MALRRDILKGGAALGAAGFAGLPGMASALDFSGAPRFIVDGRLPEAPRLIAQARAGGHTLADPQGEVVALLLAPHGRWLSADGMIVGLSSYSDFVLARDVLRGTSRPVRHAVSLNGMAHGEPVLHGGGRVTRALGALLGPAPRRESARATSFLWLA